MKKALEVKKRVSTPVMAAAWYLAGGAVGKAAGLIATPIFTRLLSSEEYATLPLFMTWVGLLGTVTGIAGALGVRGRMVIENRYGEGLSAALLGYGVRKGESKADDDGG